MSEVKKKNNRNTWALLREGLKHLVLHNGWLKLIAILISVVLWAGLISQDETITRDKSFQNVRVSVIGTEVMKNNGFILATNLDGLTADFTAAVPQKQYEAATASVYNVRVDLSRINQSGPQEIQLDKSFSNVYGKVTSITPSSITVDVEDYTIRPRIPVSAKLYGHEPDGFRYELACTPTTFTIRGPASVVNDVAYARAYIAADDIEWSEGDNYTAFPFKLYNIAGVEIDSSRMSITSDNNIEADSVIVSYKIRPVKDFSTKDLVTIKGKTQNGYKVSDVKIYPETIKVSDISEILDQMDTLYLEKNTVSVTGAKESFSEKIEIVKPSDDSYISNNTITVSVEIVPADEP
ncbi:MAG: YbbR-like domain-containing protein [Clostridia bacterium]|nr:YbbR-like domain-containing protein [Clostridia bacterium]